MTFCNALTATVNYIPGTGRCQFATEIVIMLGTVIVATRTVGGRYSQTQALDEFKRNARLFQRGDGFDAAKQLKLVA